MRHSALLAVALTALAAGACERATGPSSDALSADEARAVAAAVDDASTSVVDSRSQSGANSSVASLPGAAADVFTNHGTVSVSRDCPSGGTTTLTGDQTLVVNADSGTATLDLTASKAHAACAFTHGQDEKITVDGTVSLVAHRELSRDGKASGSQTHQGTLSYTTSDGRSGTCDVDLTAEFDLDVAAGTASHAVSGTVCGRTVDINSTWTRNG
jgi:hypothetical protein